MENSTETTIQSPDQTATEKRPAANSKSRPASMKGTERRELGNKGEGFARSFLEHAGIEVLEHNWHCPAGEADIIALEDDELVFIEVKTRSSLDKGFPEDSVTRKKRQRYELIAAYYLSDYAGPSRRIRFDVIAILVTGENQAFLKHHRDAFAYGE